MLTDADDRMAIYVPYFVPVLLPLLVGMVREGRALLASRSSPMHTKLD